MNFIFDIQINTVRENGKKISFNNFKRKNPLEYKLYFELLKTAIQNEIEPLFRHKGRFEDYFSWEQEFRMLNISKKSFEEDVMDRLNNYSYRQGVF